MKSILRIALFTLSEFFAVCAFGQTTYIETSRVCQLDQCSKATFDPPASLSYYILHFNPPVWNNNVETQTFPVPGTPAWAYWCTGSDCTQTVYKDFTGTLTRTINASNPNCPVSTQCYELVGTFNEGHNTVDQKWECFRSCGGNYFGSVTVQ